MRIETTKFIVDTNKKTLTATFTLTVSVSVEEYLRQPDREHFLDAHIQQLERHVAGHGLAGTDIVIEDEFGNPIDNLDEWKAYD